MDELFRHFLVRESLKTGDKLEIHSWNNEKVNSLFERPSSEDSIIRNFIDIKTPEFDCEYVTIAGAYAGKLVLKGKRIFFVAKQNKIIVVDKFHEFGVPV